MPSFTHITSGLLGLSATVLAVLQVMEQVLLLA